MKSEALETYSIDISFGHNDTEQWIYVTTMIGNQELTFKISLVEKADNYCSEELCGIIRDNYVAKLTEGSKSYEFLADVKDMYKYLFNDKLASTKELIEDRWLCKCHKGRVYCGEYLDLAITPLGSIYRNSKRIETITDVGSWEELCSSDCLKGKSAKEVYTQLEFDLNYTGWLFDKNSLKELVEVYTHETLDNSIINGESLSSDLANDLLNDVEKLNKLIRATSSKEVQRLLDNILDSTHKLIKEEASNSPTVTSMNTFD